MSFKSNFEEVCADKGTSPTAVCNAVGITASAYSQWTDRTMPRKTTIIKIANHLNVPTERLTQEKKPSDNGELEEYLEELRNNEDMRMMFSLCRGATKEDVAKAVEIVKAYLGK